MFVELPHDVLGLVVDGGIKAEVFGEPGALPVRAGDPHHSAADDFADLTDDGPHCSGSARDDKRLSSLRFADVEKTEIGGQTDHSEEAEEGRQGQRAGIDDLLVGTV